MQHYLPLVFFWLFYFTLHSGLASNSLKNKIYQIFPRSQRYYRICFNLFAFFSLLPLLLYSLNLEDQLLFHSQSIEVIGFVFISLGAIVLWISFKSFNQAEFLGIEQLQEVQKPAKLMQDGLYKMVRHPLYFGTILLFIGLFCLIPTTKLLLINAIVFGYLLVGSWLEEKKLIVQFGQEYIDYKKKVKGLIPFIV